MLLAVDRFPTLIGRMLDLDFVIIKPPQKQNGVRDMNFNEKLISLRKSKGLSQEELGAELNVTRQTISKWESCQSYPDFQRLVLLSDFFGLTLDKLVKDIDVQEVREKNLNSERLNSIYSDVENAKKIIKWGAIIGGCIAAVLLIVVIVLIFSFVY